MRIHRIENGLAAGLVLAHEQVARREVDVAAHPRPRRVAQALGAEVRRQVDLAEARARAAAPR